MGPGAVGRALAVKYLPVFEDLGLITRIHFERPGVVELTSNPTAGQGAAEQDVQDMLSSQSGRVRPKLNVIPTSPSFCKWLPFTFGTFK